MKNILTLLFLLLFAAFPAIAQTIPVIESPGKVSLEECSFTEYPADTTAAALVLCRNCEVVIDYDFGLQDFKRSKKYFIRLKILKEDGLEAANGSVMYRYDRSIKENVQRLAVTTYNLENGKVVATKAPKSNFITSDYTESIKKVAYTANAVKVGSVVEISYEFSSPDVLDIPDYYFQLDIPVNLSVYSISIPNWMAVTRTMLGAHSVERTTSTVNGELVEGLNNALTKEVFRAVDLPALKDEPMLFCPEQYMDAVSYEVTAIQLPGQYRDFSRSWNDVAETVGESDIYSEFYARTPYKDEVAAIAGKETDEISRITEIAKFVKDNVKWNDKISLIPKRLASVAKERTGGSADINAMIASALGAAGFKVNPVLVRLRRSGIVLENRPQLSAFNTFILHVVTSDGVDIYLDGADPSCFLNVLPEQYLVTRAFEILDKKGNYRWVDLTSLTTNTTSYLVTASVTDSSLSGVLSGKYTNGSSYDFKDTFRGAPDEEKLYDMMENFIPADLCEMKVAGLDEFSAASSLSLQFSKNCEAAGDLLIVNPFVLDLLSDAAFRHETREFPVDFSYPENISYVCRIAVPEGYVVDQLPASCIYRSPLPSSMTFRASSDDKTVMVQFKFENHAMLALPAAYDEVRKYWTDVCAVFNERIIFKKAQ